LLHCCSIYVASQSKIPVTRIHAALKYSSIYAYIQGCHTFNSLDQQRVVFFCVERSMKSIDFPSIHAYQKWLKLEVKLPCIHHSYTWPFDCQHFSAMTFDDSERSFQCVCFFAGWKQSFSDKILKARGREPAGVSFVKKRSRISLTVTAFAEHKCTF